MEDLRDRASHALPSVLLTLLSMIQALALELLWSRLQESEYLWHLDFVSLTGWVQVVVMLLGFLQVWLSYASIAMRFRWVPTIGDLVLPFVIGLLEFSLIRLMGPDHLAPWVAVLALVFVVSTWSTHLVYRQARSDPANSAFFARVRPATRRDFLSVGGVIGVLLVLAAALFALDAPGWLGLGSLVFAGGAVGAQVHAVARYWKLAMQPGDDPPEAD